MLTVMPSRSSPAPSAMISSPTASPDSTIYSVPLLMPNTLICCDLVFMLTTL